MRALLLLVLVILGRASVAQQPLRARLVPWANGVGYVTDIATSGDGRLFAATKNGLVRIVADSMVLLPTPFLDISAITLNAAEMGLLGIAFDPGYAKNSRFYAHYVYNGVGTPTRISRFLATDPDHIDVASETVLLEVPYTGFPYHKGGDIEFGPDGMLYVSLGDGFESANAQDLSSPYGSILRIDVSGDAIQTPPDNPFANASGDTLRMIWASGLRNPFRIGFDRATGDLWIGDVGEAQLEELDRMTAGDAGANFGWPCYEGSIPSGNPGCGQPEEYTAPTYEQLHPGNGGDFCAIIAGRTYRGTRWPHFEGRFFYTDYCAGDIHALAPDGEGGWLNEVALDTTVMNGMTCLVEDDDGELIVGNGFQQRIYRIVDRCPYDPPLIAQDGNTLLVPAQGSIQWYFNGEPAGTGESFVPPAAGEVHATVDHGYLCALSSDTVIYLPTDADAQDAARMMLWPNPANESLRIATGSPEACMYHVRDAQGRVVRSGRLGVDRTVETHGLSAGCYVMELAAADGRSLARERFAVSR